MGSVLWRLFSTVEVVQYIGGCSVHRADNISSVGNSFRTVEVAQYSEDSFSTVGDTFSTVEVFSVQWKDNISTVGDSFSTVGVFSTLGG